MKLSSFNTAIVAGLPLLSAMTAAAAPTSFSQAAATGWSWECGMEANIFVDNEPDDLLALLSLFSKATQHAKQHNCPPEQYPIKAVFGGGGYNPIMSHRMLQQYLGALQEAGFMPDVKSFDIDANVYPGPTSAEGPAEGFDTWGLAFDESYTRNNPSIGQTIDPLSSTLKYSPVLKVLTRQKAPVIIALRPITEYAVSWVASGAASGSTSAGVQVGRFAPNPDIQQLHMKIMEAFKRSKITMYQGAHNLRQLPEFASEF